MSLLLLPDKVIVPHIFGQLDLHWLLSSKNKVSKRWNQLIDSTLKYLKEQGRYPYVTDDDIIQFKYITDDLKVFAHKLLEYFFTLSVTKYDPSRKYKWRVLPLQQINNSNHSTDKNTYRKLFWYGAMRESLIAEGNVLRTYPSYFQGTFFCELEFVCSKSVVEEVRYAIGNYAKGRIRTENGEEWGVLIEGSSKIPLQIGFKLFDDQFVKETVEMGNYFWRPKFTIQRPPHLPSITDKAIDRYFTSAEELKQRSTKFYKYLSQLIYELKDQKWVKISKKPDVTQQQSYQEHNITLTPDERVRAIGWGLGSQKQKMDYIEQHFQSFYRMLKFLNIPNDLLLDATNFTKYPATDFDYVDVENIDTAPKYQRKWCCIL